MLKISRLFPVNSFLTPVFKLKISLVSWTSCTLIAASILVLGGKPSIVLPITLISTPLAFLAALFFSKKMHKPEPTPARESTAQNSKFLPRLIPSRALKFNPELILLCVQLVAISAGALLLYINWHYTRKSIDKIKAFQQAETIEIEHKLGGYEHLSPVEMAFSENKQSNLFYWMISNQIISRGSLDSLQTDLAAESKDIRADSLGCQANGEYLSCIFFLTNQGASRTIRFSTENSATLFNETDIYSSVKVSVDDIAANAGKELAVTIEPTKRVELRASFKLSSPAPDYVPLVILKLATDSGENIIFDFHRIPLKFDRELSKASASPIRNFLDN